MFERTKSGQQNRSLFLGVDYVCYVEGGGGSSDRSEDVSFWSKVFSACRPELKIRCVARGGKAELESLAREVMENDISGTLVAIDADYDEILGQRLSDHRVLYTFGYSWENDVFSVESLLLAHAELSHSVNIAEEEREFIAGSHAAACRALKWPARADLCALCSSASILPRDAPGRIVGISSETGLPQIRRDEVLKICRQKNPAERPRTSRGVPTILDIARFCVGHIYSYVACAILRASHRRYVSRRAPTASHIRQTCLLLFPQRLRGEPDPLSVHYFSLCAFGE